MGFHSLLCRLANGTKRRLPNEQASTSAAWKLRVWGFVATHGLVWCSTGEEFDWPVYAVQRASAAASFWLLAFFAVCDLGQRQRC